MPWPIAGASLRQLSKLRGHNDLGDELADPPDLAPWVNDDEDAVRHELTEAGAIALVDGDLERYRNDEATE